MLFSFIKAVLFRFISRKGKKMTDKEFTDIATELRMLALRKGRSYPLDSDEAEDIAQDTMLRLWALRGKVKSAAHARGLAVCIAAHQSVDKLRSKRTVSLCSPCQEPSEGSTPDTTLEEKANEEWLEAALQKLPSTEYQVLHLRQVERKGTEEIAAILGVTPQSVATLLSRARRRLMEEIRKRNK